MVDLKKMSEINNACKTPNLTLNNKTKSYLKAHVEQNQRLDRLSKSVIGQFRYRAAVFKAKLDSYIGQLYWRALVDSYSGC